MKLFDLLFKRDGVFSITRCILFNTWFVIMVKYILSGIEIHKAVPATLTTLALDNVARAAARLKEPEYRIIWKMTFDSNDAMALFGLAGGLYWGNWNVKVGQGSVVTPPIPPDALDAKK